MLASLSIGLSDLASSYTGKVQKLSSNHLNLQRGKLSCAELEKGEKNKPKTNKTQTPAKKTQHQHQNQPTNGKRNQNPKKGKDQDSNLERINEFHMEKGLEESQGQK